MTRRALAGVISCAVLAACGSEAENPGSSAAGVGGAGPSGSGVGALASTSTSATTTSSGMGGAPSSSSSGSGGVGTGGAPDPWAGPIESLEDLDLGDVPLQTTAFFPIPDKTLGFVAVVSAPSLDEAIGIYRLRPPVGTSVIFDYSMTGHTAQTFARLGWIAGADPQSDAPDAVPVQDGKWMIILGDDDNSIPSGHITVWARRTNDGQFHGGVMDVNVWIAPGVASQSYMSSVLDNLFAGSYFGVGLGTVQFFSLDGSNTVIETQDEYRQMLASTSSASGGPVVNLFVVADFGNGDFNGAIGVAGGIPGIPVKNGTTMSGVAFQPSGDAGYDATVLMHEIGHLGGLFHTTEFQIVETDPLSDTPECDDGTINSNPNSCPDHANVMFPIAYGATTFTNAQLRVLQGSALYRGILQEGGQPAAPLSVAPSEPSSAGPMSVERGRAWREVDGVHPFAPPRDALERVLAGIWCAHGGSDYVALAIRLAGSTAEGRARLQSLAEDPAAAPIVRARALHAYVRASADSAVPLRAALALAERIAKDASAITELRIAALRSLFAHAPERGAALARGLRTRDQRGDPVFDAVAARLLR